LIECFGERDINRIGTAKPTVRRQSSSPVAKRVVQSMTLHTRQCEYRPYGPGHEPSLPGLARKNTRDLGKSQIGYV
jgi:hypothetical protein